MTRSCMSNTKTFPVSVDIVYVQERRKVKALVDTGAVAGNYISSSSIAAWLSYRSYVAKLHSKFYSCTGECSVASRKFPTDCK